MLDVDIHLFLYLNRAFSGEFSTDFFMKITYLGNGLVLAALILPLLFFFDRTKFKIHLWPLVLSTALSGLIVNIIKPIADRPRPKDFFANTDVEFHIPDGTPSDKSFPSGHTQTAFGAATYLSFVYPPAAPLFISLAILTGLSRIALGVHFPLDVVTGALFGISIAILGYTTYGNYGTKKSND